MPTSLLSRVREKIIARVPVIGRTIRLSDTLKAVSTTKDGWMSVDQDLSIHTKIYGKWQFAKADNLRIPAWPTTDNLNDASEECLRFIDEVLPEVV